MQACTVLRPPNQTQHKLYVFGQDSDSKFEIIIRIYALHHVRNWAHKTNEVLGLV
jgi:hypothetical protein